MTSAEDGLDRAEQLLARLEQLRARLEETSDPEAAIDLLTELAQVAKDVEVELQRVKREADASA
jgi:hypothetical protein